MWLIKSSFVPFSFLTPSLLTSLMSFRVPTSLTPLHSWGEGNGTEGEVNRTSWVNDIRPTASQSLPSLSIINSGHRMAETDGGHWRWLRGGSLTHRSSRLSRLTECSGSLLSPFTYRSPRLRRDDKEMTQWDTPFVSLHLRSSSRSVATLLSLISSLHPPLRVGDETTSVRRIGVREMWDKIGRR